MSYAAVLFQFVMIPAGLLALLLYRDYRRNKSLPTSLTLLPPAIGITLLAVIAVVYTTPWDNYLVATRVWWYDPALVTGITLGWVPIEEYGFFVLQSIMTGLWFLFMARRVQASPTITPRRSLRTVSTALSGLIWLGSVVMLLSGWQPGRYLALELVWALPPIMLQLALGADILWHYRRLVLLSLLTATLYLSAVDLLAIHSGTWTINPDMTLGILLGGVLPVEEAIFFLLTNTLLVFGLTLALANASLIRVPLPIGRLLQLGGNNRKIEQPLEI